MKMCVSRFTRDGRVIGMTRRPAFVPALAVASAAALGASLLVVPQAQAAFEPTKSSSVTVSVDGASASVANSVDDQGTTKTGVFGGGETPSNGGTVGTGELTEMFPSNDGDFVSFEARGGVVVKACSPDTYYRRAQVTFANLPAGTKDVTALLDPTVGDTNPSSYWSDQGTQVGASGDNGANQITLTSGSTANVGEHVGGDGIAPGAKVTAVSSNVLTLSANNTATVTGPVTIYSERIFETGSLETLCDGNTPWLAGASGVSASAGTFVLGSGLTARTSAGYVVNNTNATSVSFNIYVPMIDGSGAIGNSVAMALVLDMDGDGTINDATDDVAVVVEVVSRPWLDNEMLLSACSSPSPSDAPCYVADDTGVFNNAGTARVGTASEFSVTSTAAADGSDMAELNATVAFSASVGDGFLIAEDSRVGVSLSLPTTGSGGALNFDTFDFMKANAETPLLVDPRTTSSSSATNRWDMVQAGGRNILTIRGLAKETSKVISRSTWYESCSLTISGSSVSTTGCGEGMTGAVSDNYMVISAIPGEVSLSVLNDPVGQAIAGGLVSTNAQGVEFGAETMAGTSFQFAVAGPSYTASGASRSSSGFYYVCVPTDFLSTYFTTTPAAASTSWVGTRDGATISNSFATGTCGASDGLVASLDPFGYSAPMFSLRPPSAPGSGGGSGSGSGTPAPPPTPAETSVTAPATPAPVTATQPVVFANPGQVSASQIAALTAEQVASISAEQFKELKPEVFKAMSPAQAAGLPVHLISTIRPARIAALAPAAVAAMSGEQLSGLRSAAVRRLSPTQVRAISPSSLASVTPLFVSQLKPKMVAALRPAAVRELTPEQASAIRPKALRRMPGVALRQLSPDAISAMSVRQLKRLKPKQVRKLTQAQRTALRPVQLKAVGLRSTSIPEPMTSRVLGTDLQQSNNTTRHTSATICGQQVVDGRAIFASPPTCTLLR